MDGPCEADTTGTRALLGEAGRRLFYPDSRPWTRWWWFNVELRDEDIRAQLDWARSVGFGGVELAFIYPLPNQPQATSRKPQAMGAQAQAQAQAGRRGPDFLSPEWSAKVALAKQHCEGIGLGCDFSFGTLWPFGGSFVSEQDSAQTFAGPSKQRLGRSWELPVEGRILNHMDRNALRRYSEVMGKALGPALKGTRSALFCDSFEVEPEGMWTAGFDKAFADRFGYDLREFMPTMDEHPDVRYDYRKLVSEYLLDGFFHPFTEVSREFNAFTRVQCHGAPCDIVSAFAAADVPESEAILFDPEYARVPASAAALAGAPVVTAEAFTCLYGWSPWPGPGPHQGEEQAGDLKLLADALFANGVNHIFWHGMPYQTGVDSRQLTANSRSPEAASCKPKAVSRFYASVHVGPDSSFVRELPALNGYMEKVCGLMKQGRTYSDVAVYLPIEDQWMKGELPKQKQKPSAKYHWELHYLRPPAELHGYSPLWVSQPFLEQARFKDGRLVCGEARFNLLYVDCEWLDNDALAQVLRLAKDGLPVCLKRIPKLPGRVADKHILRGYRQSLEALTGLDNVSSDFANVSQNPPLVRGYDAPDSWCREVGDGLLFFFGHPASRGLTYPMRYGQSEEARTATRDVVIRVDDERGEERVRLAFAPQQSLLLRVPRAGAPAFEDIRCDLPAPVGRQPVAG